MIKVWPLPVEQPWWEPADDQDRHAVVATSDEHGQERRISQSDRLKIVQREGSITRADSMNPCS
jgi:hypothetical protein